MKRDRNDNEMDGWVKNLDVTIAERNLLMHPFYPDWQAGTLSRARLQLYAAQYHLYVEAFPVHLAELANRSKGALRSFILENLAEEENPAAPHPKRWRVAGLCGCDRRK